MTPAEFKKKWAKYSGKETSAYQEHFNDLCALLGLPSPVAADPSGTESFCFQKRVVKDAELFAFDHSGRVAELIRGGANRQTLKLIKESGDIFFAVSDREWILDGANVHVSMIGFDDGTEKGRLLDGRQVTEINSNLTATSADTTSAKRLSVNFDTAFMGDTKGGRFDITQARAAQMLGLPNPHGKPNSDVIVPWVNGLDVTRRSRGMFIIDFGTARDETECAKYEAPFLHVLMQVQPERAKNKRALYAKNWWRHVEPRPGMLAALAPLPRFLTTLAVSKYRLFAWMTGPTLPDHQLFAFARDNDYFFGVLHSRLHEVWSRVQGTQVRERESGFRYTSTSCFETFSFPEPNKKQENGIAAAARELNELRENWLNPPEWTLTRELRFPGSLDGPWSRFVHEPDKQGIGIVRYPRIEPRDEECAKKLAKRTLANLYNERPAWLAHAHAKLDAAVAAAYGFEPDLSDEAILEKLLALNLDRSAAERSSSARRKPRTSREKTTEELI
jgi:hypothetical protein